ncbi:hypothetical protein NDI76_11860 [Halogeometricum sp. S1BR25-6]|uniref:Uncharacterized protein n=1 Tax=Halogeometricum salsisoli TaxID=2950536 RepID=A0ABU2GH69_9EURY|nr:hypothetical protein [Halogeometricum sp. S1BR25-6]MDS0299438.1 hypothetical protein [Halogeometricum sp. S1BR25-6]
MSNSSSTVPRKHVVRLREVLETTPNALRFGLRVVAYPVQFAAFWLAVALPFLYMPLLYGGVHGEQATVFGSLLALNAAALVVGHGHSRDRGDG